MIYHRSSLHQEETDSPAVLCASSDNEGSRNSIPFLNIRDTSIHISLGFVQHCIFCLSWHYHPVILSKFIPLMKLSNTTYLNSKIQKRKSCSNLSYQSELESWWRSLESPPPLSDDGNARGSSLPLSGHPAGTGVTKPPPTGHPSQGGGIRQSMHGFHHFFV